MASSKRSKRFTLPKHKKKKKVKGPTAKPRNVNLPNKDKRRVQAVVKKKLEEKYLKTPKSFVISRGEVGKHLELLTSNMRDVMRPYTATSLRSRKRNSMKDFVMAATELSVTHLLMFSKSDLSPILRIVRVPKGPTLTFQIDSYSLVKDVKSAQSRPIGIRDIFANPPLLVLNNFAKKEQHMQLVTTVFQNMFPSIDVAEVKLKDIHRVVLFSFDDETQTIDFRHYAIRVAPVGASRPVKMLLKASLPDLSQFNDISDFINSQADGYESEGDDVADNKVILPQSLPTSGNEANQQSAIRLREIGPRMVLSLLKIEQGLSDGEVLYHKYVHKTEEELAEMRKNIAKKMQLKAQRKREQEKNVARKLAEKEEHRIRTGGKPRDESEKTPTPRGKEKSSSSSSSFPASRRGNQDEFGGDIVEGSDDENVEGPTSAGYEGFPQDQEDDDEEYFRQEVGHAPSAELGLSKKSFQGRPSGFVRKSQGGYKERETLVREDIQTPYGSVERKGLMPHNKRKFGSDQRGRKKFKNQRN